MITKNETTKTLERAWAASLTGPWTIDRTGDWAGWGDWIEGPALTPIKGADGKDGWRIYFDDYRDKTYWYSDSFDGLNTWTKKQQVGGVSGAVRHFTVIREPTTEVEAATKPAGTPEAVTWDRHSLMIGGKRVMIWAGEFQPFRLPSPSMWRDVLQKMKATGYNAVTLYIDWGYHSSEEGHYDFSGVRNVERAIQMAEDEGLYVIIRPGPYVNAELTMGGFPGWVTRQKAMARTDDPEYLKAVDEWQTQIDTIVARHQITNGGGKVIAFQIENELGDTSPSRQRYMQHLADKARADGITVPLFHNSASRLPNWTPRDSSAPWAVPGPTDLYAFDGYPGGGCTGTRDPGSEGEITLPLPAGHRGFVYVFSGGVAVEQTLINAGQAGVLTAEDGDTLNLAAGQDGARALVATALPLNEPLVRYGPFAMNDHDGVKQAFTDYQNGLF